MPGASSAAPSSGASVGRLHALHRASPRIAADPGSSRLLAFILKVVPGKTRPTDRLIPSASVSFG
jgi:hypothetical protein